jgi:hypothetical protein
MDGPSLGERQMNFPSFASWVAPSLVAAGLLASPGVHATTIFFGDGTYTQTGLLTTFADGTFTNDGIYGFSPRAGGSTVNATSGEIQKIFFNTPVELNSLNVEKVPLTLPDGGTPNPFAPTTITVSTFDSSNNQLSSQTLAPFGNGTLSFNEMGVSAVGFDFTGGHYNLFGDGRTSVQYVVTNVSYTLSAVPEPSTWAMLLIGFAGIGFMAHRRRCTIALT